MIIPFKRRAPKVHPRAFVAPGAAVIGRVTIGAGSSVWFGAVLRGDLNAIRVGRRTNIQDHCVLHVERDLPCVVGDGVIIGHQATVHACRVGDGALIGIGARILNGAVIGEHAVIGAGSVVLEGTKIPPHSLAVGVPAKVVRRLSAADARKSRLHALRYERLAADYRGEFGAGFLLADPEFSL